MRVGKKKKTVAHPSIKQPQRMPEPIKVDNWPVLVPDKVNAPVKVGG